MPAAGTDALPTTAADPLLTAAAASLLRGAADLGPTNPGSGPAGETLRVLTGPRVVLRGGQPVPFTRLEFDLLVFLALNPRRVFTRLQLLSNVWGYEHAVARTVDVHVRRLRSKVARSVPLVTTVHGVGYRLADNAPVRVDDRD
nr:winged helix-turn-helix domain-containing protein [Plantactinospora endophytica]